MEENFGNISHLTSVSSVSELCWTRLTRSNPIFHYPNVHLTAHLKRVDVVGTELLARHDVCGGSDLLAGGCSPQPAPDHVGPTGVVDPASKDNKTKGVK